jgi:hypothetical protein
VAADDPAGKPLVPPQAFIPSAVASAVLVALRLCGVIGWAWQWLISPLWGLAAAILLACVYIPVVIIVIRDGFSPPGKP